MAEGWTHSLHCQYLTNGMCREGERCQHMHQYEQGLLHPGSSTSTRRLRMDPSYPRCRFYARGQCKFGQRCRFVHANDPTSPDSSTDMQAASVDSAGSSSAQRLSGNRNAPGLSQKTTVLKKQKPCADSGLGEDNSENWVNAPEFVPAGKGNISTSSERVPPKSNVEVLNPTATANKNIPPPSVENTLCPFQEARGECKLGSKCVYIHGEVCEMCSKPCLHPHNKEQRKKHANECNKRHEQNIALSNDKACGICFEVIMEKSPLERRFGILPNCNHCFCLTCIRKWRQAKQFENNIIRSCPECRVTSDFVCPSMYWVDTKEDKEKLIKDYKVALSMKHCKYFRSSRGKCPFGNKCFYLHAYPDGTKADVGPPMRQRRHNSEGELVLQQFLEDLEDLASIFSDSELLPFFSDSENSDWSDYDFFFD